MGIWDRIGFAGRTTGIWEAGTKKKGRPVLEGHQKRRWDFSRGYRKRLGYNFYKTLRHLPETDIKKIIVSLAKQKEETGRLTNKQWKLLGLLMTKADPTCVENPVVIIQKEKKQFDAGSPILRKKSALPHPL